MEVLHKAIQYMADNSFTENELRNKLLNDFKDIKERDQRIDYALDVLRKEKIVNDFRLARSLAVRHCHKGDLFLIELFEKRNISPDIATVIINSMEDESIRAANVGQLRIEKTPNVVLTKRQMKRFLEGRGFSCRAVNEALLKLNFQL
jgi:SOS response regulatory protein OraA/RecX